MPIVRKAGAATAPVQPTIAKKRKRTLNPKLDAGSSDRSEAPAPSNAEPRAGKPVGKNSPPEEHQFQKGQSGNPSGRPKRKPDADTDSMIIGLMEELITLRTAQGKKKKVTRAEGLMRATYERAVKGDIRATKLMFETYAKGCCQRDGHAGGGPID